MSVADRVPGVSEYGSVDPAPPSVETDVESLREILLDENSKMFQRMRAVFSLRNNRSSEAVSALCEGFGASSALLRQSEHVMVRHEAAEALGAIGDRSARPILQQFLTDPLPEVSESCEVALDLLALCDEPKEIDW